MLSWLADKLAVARLRAHAERTLLEQLTRFSEANDPVAPDPGEWHLAGDDPRQFTQQQREDNLDRARKLARENPHARQILAILENYVVGPGLDLHHKPDNARADQDWQDFIEANETHFSYREFARRVWRDGEAFLRVFPAMATPQVRFIDPERIRSSHDFPDSEGILTAADDVEDIHAYTTIDRDGTVDEIIPADEVLHCKINADSNTKRGDSLFTAIAHTLDCYSEWTHTELHARKLQASIVLWRKVQGSPSQVAALADALKKDDKTYVGVPNETVRQENFRPGGIITTNHATELEFLQPRTNIRDAVPLGRMLLLATAAGVSLPEFMLTSDASNANYSSTMIAEGPAVKVFSGWQEFFGLHLTRLWRMVMGRRSTRPTWQYPELVNRDRHQEREADAQLVDRRVISRAEAARRDRADPDEMRREIEEESRNPALNPAATTPDQTPGALSPKQPPMPNPQSPTNNTAPDS